MDELLYMHYVQKLHVTKIKHSGLDNNLTIIAFYYGLLH